MTHSLTRIAVLAASLCMAALVACAPAAPPADQGPAMVQKAVDLADPKAIIEAAADPCLGAKGLFLQSLCGHPELKDLTAQIKTALVAEGDGIDLPGAQEMSKGQTGWLAATRTYCAVDDGAGVLTPEQVGCIKAQLNLRVKEAAEIIETRGGFTFQRVEVNEATKAAVTGAAGGGPMDDLPVTKEVDYPRINAATPQAEAFNLLMRTTVAALRPPAGVDAGQTSEAVAYEIAFAGPDLVSVMFTANQTTPGAMHPETTTRVVNVVMATGKELTPADVFAAPEARWQALLVTRATQGLRRQLRELRGVELSQSDIRDTITKPHNWRITERALVLVFPPNSVGPSTLGVVRVEVPWKDLKALLKPDAPAPIRQS
jgi:hypothetical protein